MNSIWGKFLAAGLFCGLATSAFAAERYQDRQFTVGVMHDVVYASNVPALSSYHAITKALFAYKMTNQDATVASYTLDLQAPTLYGSYVIDSLLTAKNVEHETYFVEGVAHEFYDGAPYTDSVQNRVFHFLYGLTQKTESIETRTVLAAAQNAVQMGDDNLSFTVSRGTNLKYRVYDLSGRAVMPTGRVSAGESVNLNALDAGVYVLMVQGLRPVRFGLRK